MKYNHFTFFLKLILLSALLFLIFYLSINSFPAIINKFYPFIISFFAIITLGFHILLSKKKENKFSSFVNNFMAFTMLKLLIYLTVLLVMVFADKTNAKSFIITYFINYLIFTSFEVIQSTTQQINAKKNNKNS